MKGIAVYVKDILVVETAGLCHRCAPGTAKTLSICVYRLFAKYQDMAKGL
jgi:Ni2+-binding GTPase involved in maturation of urease and hydrogenase